MKKTASVSILIAMMLAGMVWASGEIIVNYTIKITKSPLNVQQTANQTIDLAIGKPNIAGLSMSVPTTAAGTAVPLGAVSTNGWAWFQNTDATNFVEVGIQEGGLFFPLARLNATESFVMRMAQGVSPYARANSAAVVMAYFISDN